MEGRTELIFQIKMEKGGELADKLQVTRMMKKVKKLGPIILALLISLTFLPIPYGVAPAQAQSVRALEVLEVQPGTSYDLTNFDWSFIPDRTVHLTQMSMPEFISKIDEINGKYDIVYIGNNTGSLLNPASYSALGSDFGITILPEGGINGICSKEYYSDNDITNKRAAVLKDFISSKQLTIFDQSIFNAWSCLKDTKLYQNFHSDVNNANYPNVVLVDTSFCFCKASNVRTAFSVYMNNSQVAKRPELTLNSKPSEYDGTDKSYQKDKSMGFNFDIRSNSSTNDLTVKLYQDINGDGIFKAKDDYAGQSEQVYELDHRNSGTGCTVNYRLPDTSIGLGLQPWKLEITDNGTGAKSYVTGATAFKADSGNELKIRVLQLKPSGNTFSVYDDLKNANGQNLLYKEGVYNISVTEMSVSDFNAAYADLQFGTPPSKPAKVNGENKTAPTDLNGNYDMVIMGFADIYGGNDLTNNNALQALQNFIKTNQSVMFTHDTQTYDVKSPGTWAYNMTQNFRSLLGQQRYYRTAPDSTRYYDPMPNACKDSYGFSNLTLDRANFGLKNGLVTFQTTTQAHKINDNLVTQFPFILGDIQVAPTHFQYFQLDLEDENIVPVYTLKNSSRSTIYAHPGDGRNDYFTYTKGTITFSGTGHSRPDSVEEDKMFVNTIIKASRGANHAPTLEIHGISDGMNIATVSTSIDFSFKATDIDLRDQYLNADIELATSQDGSNFSDYQKVKSFRAADDVNSRLQNGAIQPVSIAKTADPNIKAYKVKVVAFDDSNAQVSQEVLLNNVDENIIQNPSITSRSGYSQMSVIKNEALQTNIGFTLIRPAASFKLDLANSLSGSTMDVEISKVLCDGKEIEFNVDNGDHEKIYPKDSAFSGGMYTIYTAITLGNGDMQEDQSFTVTLTDQTSALDAVTQSEYNIPSEPSLNIYVVSSPKLH